MRGLFNILFYIVFWLVAFVATLGVALVLFVPVFLLTFVGMGRRMRKAQQKLTSMLMPGETILACDIQHRAYALSHRRVLIAITNSRVMTLHRGVFGGFGMNDIQWKDLHDVRIEENILPGLCGSNLSFEHANERVPQLYLPAIPSEAARRIYSHAQSEEHAWEEKRRIRSIEEARAMAGGVIVQSGSSHTEPPALPGNRIVDDIARAKALLDSGAISDAEYHEMKAKIISSVR